MLIGLTGSLGSGKSTVLKEFRELGALTISADDIVHQVLERTDVKKEIARIFGTGVFSGPDIDRRRLAARVFSSDAQRHKLEEILHPLVYERVMEFYKGHPGSIVVAEIPLLFESGKKDDFDMVVLVVCPRDQAIKRLEERGLTKDEAEKRLRVQMPVEEKARLSDFVIDNSGSWEDTSEQVRKIWQKISARAGVHSARNSHGQQ